MHTSRREFLALSAAAGFTAIHPALARAAFRADPGTFFDWKPAGEGGWVGMSEGGNTLVIHGKAGAILVDCKNAPYGKSLRREAEHLGKPFVQVINTHHHGDHTGGNWAFTPDLPLLAHVNCKARIPQQLDRYASQGKDAVRQMEAMNKLKEVARPQKEQVLADVKAFVEGLGKLKASDFLPTQTMDGSREIEAGSEKITLNHFGPGHTDTDLVVFFPARNVLHAGDLLFNKRHPYIDRPGGASTRGWQKSLEKAATMCDEKTVVVPGHGDIGRRDLFQEQSRYFDTVRDLVTKARSEGKNKQDLQHLEPPAAYAAYAGSNWALTAQAIFEELEEEGASTK